MPFADLGRRAGSTMSNRRAIHRALDMRFRGVINGQVVDNGEGPGPGMGEKIWWPTGSLESWYVPFGVTELLISGQGGSRPGDGHVNASFGTFRIPVNPGQLVDIMVGTGTVDISDPGAPGFPDGGYGNYEGDSVPQGGAGSTRLRDFAGTTLLVAPGVGGRTPPALGQFDSSRFVWTAYDPDPSHYIGADPSDWPWRLGEVVSDFPDIVGGMYVIDAQNPGGNGGGTGGTGGAGAAPTAAYAFSRAGGGGGGGGWASGAGGTCFHHHYEAFPGDNQSNAHTSRSGSSGQPYAIASAVYVEPPLTTSLGGSVALLGPHLYARWEIPA